jgi:peptide/nickel transport system substrate-binding protein
MAGTRERLWRWGTSRYSRRRLLRSAAVAGVGLSGAVVMACAGGGTTTQPMSGGRTGGQAAEPPQPGGIYSSYDQANPPTLDPHRTSAVTAMRAVSPVMSRLLRFKTSQDVEATYNLETQPDLALSVESPDAITWTVKLRPDAKFHNVAPVNGRGVEAEDIKATFTRALEPTNPNRGSLTVIDPNQIETPSRDTVVFKLKYPYAPFPKLLASGVYGWIFPREAGTGYDPAKQIIGSGPFLFESFTPDVAFIYKKNPSWFEQGQPYVDGVRHAIIPDAAQRLAQFTAGNIDFIGNLYIDDLNTVRRSNPNAQVIARWDQGGPIVYFQLGDPASPFQDIRLRRAVSLAIDRESFAKALLRDQWQQSFNVPLNMGKWAIKIADLPSETAQWYRYNLDRAKRLVEEAGAAGMSLKLLYPTPHPRDPYLKTAAETVANMLSALPWRLTLVFIDYNKDWVGGGKGVRYGNFPSDSLVLTGVEGRTDVDEYLYGWWHSKSTSSISRLQDPTLDAMIERARTLLNEDERARASVEIQKYMADKVYSGAGNPSGYVYTVVQARVRNYTTGDEYGVGTSTWGKLWLKR